MTLSNTQVEVQDEAITAFNKGDRLVDAVQKYVGTMFEQTFRDAFSEAENSAHADYAAYLDDQADRYDWENNHENGFNHLSLDDDMKNWNNNSLNVEMSGWK